MDDKCISHSTFYILHFRFHIRKFVPRFFLLYVIRVNIIVALTCNDKIASLMANKKSHPWGTALVLQPDGPDVNFRSVSLRLDGVTLE